MTYSHNNLKMTSVTATTKAARATGCGGSGGKQQQFINRRTPPTMTASMPIPISKSTTTTINKLAFENNNNKFNLNKNQNNNVLHSNSIACSTNMQQHPLMGGSGSPSSGTIDILSTPGCGSYFFNQRKQPQYQQLQQQRQSQWQSPNNDYAGGSLSSGSVGSNCSGSSSGGGGAFFHKNTNYAGQYFGNNNNNRRSAQKHQQQQSQQQHQQRGDERTPTNVKQHYHHTSPATILGGGITTHVERNAATTGRKRRPKYQFQSPIITAPLGVGGNISPTHPLLPSVLTHYAGSKCFDAPAPSAVPKPPEHWTQNVKSRSAASIIGGGCSNGAVGCVNASSCARDKHTLAGHVVKSSKRNLLDDFDTHNLKLLLNVQS